MATRHTVESVLESVNAPVAHHKTEGPSTTVSLLGIQFSLSSLCRLTNSYAYRVSWTPGGLKRVAPRRNWSP